MKTFKTKPRIQKLAAESADQQQTAQLPHIVNNNSRSSTAHGRSGLTAPEPKPGGGSTCDAPSPCEVDAHSDSPPNAHGRSRLTAPEPKPGGGSTCDAPSPCEVDAHSDSPSNAHEGLSLTAPEPEPPEQPLASSREHPPLPDLDEYEATSDMDCDDERWEYDTAVLSDDGSHPNTHTNVIPTPTLRHFVSGNTSTRSATTERQLPPRRHPWRCNPP